MTDDDLRMLARAAYTVLRELKPRGVIPAFVMDNALGFISYRDADPAHTRATKYIDFVHRQNLAIWDSEFRRDDQMKMGFRP
jgi:hypothetical protein